MYREIHSYPNSIWDDNNKPRFCVVIPYRTISTMFPKSDKHSTLHGPFNLLRQITARVRAGHILRDDIPGATTPHSNVSTSFQDGLRKLGRNDAGRRWIQRQKIRGETMGGSLSPPGDCRLSASAGFGRVPPLGECRLWDGAPSTNARYRPTNYTTRLLSLLRKRLHYATLSQPRMPLAANSYTKILINGTVTNDNPLNSTVFPAFRSTYHSEINLRPTTLITPFFGNLL